MGSYRFQRAFATPVGASHVWPMASTRLRWENSIQCCRSTTCRHQRPPSPLFSHRHVHSPLSPAGELWRRTPAPSWRHEKRERRLYSVPLSSYSSRFSHPITLSAPAVGFCPPSPSLPDCEAKETFVAAPCLFSSLLRCFCSSSPHRSRACGRLGREGEKVRRE